MKITLNFLHHSWSPKSQSLFRTSSNSKRNLHPGFSSSFPVSSSPQSRAIQQTNKTRCFSGFSCLGICPSGITFVQLVGSMTLAARDTAIKRFSEILELS